MPGKKQEMRARQEQDARIAISTPYNSKHVFIHINKFIKLGLILNNFWSKSYGICTCICKRYVHHYRLASSESQWQMRREKKDPDRRGHRAGRSGYYPSILTSVNLRHSKRATKTSQRSHASWSWPTHDPEPFTRRHPTCFNWYKQNI